MDDKLIEQKLRESFSPELPIGMRERVLGRAGQELLSAPVMPRRPWFLNWRLAFAASGLLIVLAGNLSDCARGSRLAALAGANETAMPKISIRDRAREIDCLLAANAAACDGGGERQGGAM